MSEDDERVGSVAEEVVKLLGALQEWARESEHKSAAVGAASVFYNVNEHIATGGDDCRYCPLCQVIGVVRQTSPEVKRHLTSAASSLLQAVVTAMLAQPSGGDRSRTREPVEKIDLSDEVWKGD